MIDNMYLFCWSQKIISSLWTGKNVWQFLDLITCRTLVQEDNRTGDIRHEKIYQKLHDADWAKGRQYVKLPFINVKLELSLLSRSLTWTLPFPFQFSSCQNYALVTGALTGSAWLRQVGAGWSECLPLLPLLQVPVAARLPRLEEAKPGLHPKDGRGRLWRAVCLLLSSDLQRATRSDKRDPRLRQLMVDKH